MLVRLVTAELATASLLWLSAAQAEFYTWIDDAGRRRISNIAPAAIEQAGGIARRAHPYSIESQYARLRADLERRDAELAAAVDESDTTSGNDRPPMSVDALRGLLAPGGERPGR